MINMPMADKDIPLLSFWKLRNLSSIIIKQQPHLFQFHKKTTVSKIRNLHLLPPSIYLLHLSLSFS